MGFSAVKNCGIAESQELEGSSGDCLVHPLLVHELYTLPSVFPKSVQAWQHWPSSMAKGGL